MTEQNEIEILGIVKKAQMLKLNILKHSFVHMQEYSHPSGEGLKPSIPFVLHCRLNNTIRCTNVTNVKNVQI